MQPLGKKAVYTEPFARNKKDGKNNQYKTQAIARSLIIINPSPRDGTYQFPQGAREEKQGLFPPWLLPPGRICTRCPCCSCCERGEALPLPLVCKSPGLRDDEFPRTITVLRIT